MKFRTRILCGVLSVLLTCPNMIFAENMTKQVDANAKPEEVVAYVNFGDAVESFGMTATMGDEPYITVGNKMGREGWILNPNNLQKLLLSFSFLNLLFRHCKNKYAGNHNRKKHNTADSSCIYRRRKIKFTAYTNDCQNRK